MKRNDFGASQEFKTNKAVNLFTPNRALYAVLLIISLLIIVCSAFLVIIKEPLYK